MYENACYEKPFLKSVIARIDFVAAIADLSNAVPPGLANKLTTQFPIAEPAEAVGIEFQLGPGPKHSERETRLKQWNFYGKDREKHLSLLSAFFTLEYRTYKTFEGAKEEFSFIVEAIRKEFPDAKAGRFGLRYINQIEIEGLALPAGWNEYIAPELLAAIAFFQFNSLGRLMHLADMRYDDLNIRFQFGMPNPDYPATIKRPLFVLDLDGYVRTAHELADSLQYFEQVHERIQELFEKSITDKLRERMNAKRPGPII
jgi:uncharacterized protein (TIGR04255 family)